MNNSIELLKTAMEMEKKGKAFYDKAATTCKNKLGQEIFAMLAKDEVVHLERISKIYNSLEASAKWTDDWMKISQAHAPVNAIFKDLASKYHTATKADSSDLEALDVGIDLETKAVAFYEKQLGQASDPMEKKFAEKMIAEERSHRAVLVDTKAYLEDPAAYFVEMEKPGFDRG
jgi:rubrerythrin